MHRAMSKYAILFFVLVGNPAIPAANSVGNFHTQRQTQSTPEFGDTGDWPYGPYDKENGSVSIPDGGYVGQFVVTNDSLKCGGSVANTVGQIEYKQFEAVGRNERCVWVVQPINVTSVYIQLSPNNPAPAPGTLLVTGIGTYGGKDGIIVNSVTPNATQITIHNATMLVITFTTTANASGGGFSLLYQFLTGGAVKASPDSVNVIASSDLGYIRHPKLQTAVYPAFDLSVFIILPNETCDFPNKIRLRYSEIKLEGSFYDSLFVYEFVRPFWQLRGRIYSGAESQLITGQDMLMVVFESDGSGEYEGFELVYAVC